MGYELEGMQWCVDEFKEYVESIKDTLTWANSVTIHHTASPDLDMRPSGFSVKHMQYLKEYYRDDLGWSAGPHLFTDDFKVSGMSGMHRRGVHAVAFNSNSIGIEMLGYYDRGGDDPFSGRGESVLEITFHITRILLDAMGLDINEDTIHFHRNDPNTDKTCCGNAIEKDWFVDRVKNVGDEVIKPPVPVEPVEPITTPDIPSYTGGYIEKGGEWYVPIALFVSDFYNEGFTLTNESVFIVRGRHLEDTFYNVEGSATYCSLNELLNIS